MSFSFSFQVARGFGSIFDLARERKYHERAKIYHRVIRHSFSLFHHLLAIQAAPTISSRWFSAAASMRPSCSHHYRHNHCLQHRWRRRLHSWYHLHHQQAAATSQDGSHPPPLLRSLMPASSIIRIKPWQYSSRPLRQSTSPQQSTAAAAATTTGHNNSYKSKNAPPSTKWNESSTPPQSHLKSQA